MSLGYAEKLSYREDVGSVGMPEVMDDPDATESKIMQLAQLIRESRHTVGFTGAGISTSCGIPDFRGPHGIWTLQKEGREIPKGAVAFDRARPSLCHVALRRLLEEGLMSHIISQNVDGLHRRSGVARGSLSELHGNSFLEVCNRCQEEYFRDFEVETVGGKLTVRRCARKGCRGKLRDTVLDWEDELPSRELREAEEQCNNADLVLCLGTSLQITPACDIPLKTVKRGGKMVIVNLQKTPKDKKAHLVIHRPVDQVMRRVMELLDISLPPFVRLHHIHLALSSSPLSRGSGKMTFRFGLESEHGPACRLPFIKCVTVSFPNSSEDSVVLPHQPFQFNKTLARRVVCEAKIRLELDGCGCDETTMSVFAMLKGSCGLPMQRDEDNTNRDQSEETVKNSGGTAAVEANESEIITDESDHRNKGDGCGHGDVDRSTKLDGFVRNTVELGRCGGALIATESNSVFHCTIATDIVFYDHVDTQGAVSNHPTRKEDKPGTGTATSLAPHGNVKVAPKRKLIASLRSLQRKRSKIAVKHEDNGGGVGIPLLSNRT